MAKAQPKEVDEAEREFNALSTVFKALASLNKDERERVIRYCISRLGIYVADAS